MTASPGVPEHMPLKSGQPDAGPPEFSSQADLVLIFIDSSKGSSRLSQPCPGPGSKPEPVAW